MLHDQCMAVLGTSGAVEDRRRIENSISLFKVFAFGFQIDIIETERSLIWFWAHLTNLVVEMGLAIGNYCKLKGLLLSTNKNTDCNLLTYHASLAPSLKRPCLSATTVNFFKRGLSCKSDSPPLFDKDSSHAFIYSKFSDGKYYFRRLAKCFAIDASVYVNARSLEVTLWRQTVYSWLFGIPLWLIY